MGNCNSCNGSCGSCGGCANTLTLTQREIDLLRAFGQIPFLPVARKADDMTPICFEEAGEDLSLVLACLETKGLIDIDYRAPLSGFNYAAYKGYPVHGSMALTARGQSVLELLDLQGAEEV